jgi:hypothetical protein
VKEMTWRTRRWFALAATVTALAGCEPEGRFSPLSVQGAFASALTQPPGTTVSLDSLGPAKWTSMYLFGPYTTDATVQRCLGAASGYEAYGIASRDDIYVLLFRNPSGGISSMTLARDRFEFGDSTTGREYAKGHARFTVVSRRSGNGNALIAADTSRSC